ncbi:hypothetical protein [Litorivita pollutaquae]|nr:hypothetical protein [Litorivita pollutaquae]
MSFRPLLFSLLLSVAPLCAAAQDNWPDLDAVLFPQLAQGSGVVEAAFFLPDRPTPSQAREAIAIVYEWIQGSAGSTRIVVGHYTLDHPPLQFTFRGHVSNLFGHSPRDPQFLPDRIELTMTTLKDGEPRCCPSGETRYAIDRTTQQAHVLWTR